MSLVLVQAAITVSVRSGGKGWHRSKDNDKYSDKYQMSSVRSNMGRQSRNGLGCGQGSVARVSTLESDGDLLKVLKGESGRVSSGGRIFSIGQAKEHIDSRVPRSSCPNPSKSLKNIQPKTLEAHLTCMHAYGNVGPNVLQVQKL
ncbi:hypothetical protein TIFTF001_012039 [Ficus carica]|uniref:Uncharacterized protein n=1 Tax=Ficus carica TaxID=3494 RepID=A0AA88D3D1_FICCA|nr:hypothetical protein TIFTF001_012039 [Ficus carica]